MFCRWGCPIAHLPPLLMLELHHSHEHYLAPNARIAHLDKRLKELMENDTQGQNLKTIPSIGDIVASLCLAQAGML